MSLYCAMGSVETDLSSAAERSARGKLWRNSANGTACSPCPPTKAACTPAPASSRATRGSTTATSLKAVLPALGTHTPCSPSRSRTCLAPCRTNCSSVHNWRTDVETLGEVPAEFIHEQSEGKLNLCVAGAGEPAHCTGGFDLILSIGQVVPHEVIGMANYNKNILVGTGGREGINRSHYLGAVYGMERIMGRAENPVRNVLNYASDHFLRHLPIVYVLTVVGRMADGQTGRARPLYRRRCRVLSPRRRTEPTR